MPVRTWHASEAACLSSIVLGGGFVPGSVILLAGEPGIGKSTLLLTVSETVAKARDASCTIGRKSQNQVRMRADRLGILTDNLYFASSRM